MGSAFGKASADVPVINIAPFVDVSNYDDSSREKIAKEWDEAMSNVGFAIIEGHGVAAETISALRSGAMAFFSQESHAKDTYDHGPLGNPDGGYKGMGKEAVSHTRDELGADTTDDDVKQAKAALPDLVESYNFKPASTKPKPAEMADTGAAYYAEMLRVLSCIHRMSAMALDLPPDYFTPYYTPSTQVDFRMAYYPPVPPDAQNTSAMRFGEHTDYTGFTILHQDESDVGDLDAGGLQVRLNNQWHAVTPQPGTFVVNIGDLYEIWTNGRWRSTVHRVMKPPAGSAAASRPRLSLPFFTGPDNDAIIDAMPTCVDENHPAKYKPVKALDHLLRKLAESNVHTAKD